MKIYLDTSVLNRIFDDQSQPRIYLEATSTLIIIMLVEYQNIELVSSDILLFENYRNSYDERRAFVNLFLQKANRIQSINDKILERARNIEKDNIGGIDALHLACAEELGADYFITCDDRIIKRYKGLLMITNPINFIADILQKDGN